MIKLDDYQKLIECETQLSKMAMDGSKNGGEEGWDGKKTEFMEHIKFRLPFSTINKYADIIDL